MICGFWSSIFLTAVRAFMHNRVSHNDNNSAVFAGIGGSFATLYADIGNSDNHLALFHTLTRSSNIDLAGNLLMRRTLSSVSRISLCLSCVSAQSAATIPPLAWINHESITSLTCIHRLKPNESTWQVLGLLRDSYSACNQRALTKELEACLVCAQAAGGGLV
jgi:hypothetical protein